MVRRAAAHVVEVAQQLDGREGLDPYFWGISRKQFEAVLVGVRAAHAAGEIPNQHGNDPSHPFYYDPAVFNDPARGPNMHQVNAGFIKPRTLDMGPLPCLSYSLALNWDTAGLPCELCTRAGLIATTAAAPARG